jgi:hypothetical protein
MILDYSAIMVDSIKGKITVFWDVTHFILIKTHRLSEENALYFIREI